MVNRSSKAITKLKVGKLAFLTVVWFRVSNIVQLLTAPVKALFLQIMALSSTWPIVSMSISAARMVPGIDFPPRPLSRRSSPLQSK